MPDKQNSIRCPICKPDVANGLGLDTPANDNLGAIWMRRDSMLERIQYAEDVAAGLRNWGKSRRGTGNEIVVTVYEFVELGGTIYWPNGDVFEPTDNTIEAAFRSDESWKWLSGFMRGSFAQKPQKKVLPRIRYADIAVRIRRRMPR